MNYKIVHRGPDDDGIFTEINNEFSLGLGMRRLSIIDVVNGSQPMYSDDLNISIIFNGEIYNYKELKASLIKLNVSFKTNSDTEVILKLYETHGINSLNKLEGMFAISIYDKSINKIFLVRDYFGEKPLYYLINSEGLIWASELKSIITVLKEKPLIDLTSLNLFFQLTYIPAPNTIYEKIKKLIPNSILTYDISSRNYTCEEMHRDFKEYEINSFKQAKKLTHDLVYESVKSRSISDVPIGSFLSGGVDSSIVSLCLSKISNSKINTFSIGFNDTKFDESSKSNLVSKIINSNHYQFIIDESDFADNLDEILLNFDEPFGDSSALASFLVAKKTSAKVKVALTGDGGDEVFGGYNKYLSSKINSYYTSIVPEIIHNRIKNIINEQLKIKTDNRGTFFKTKKLLNAISYHNDYYINLISLGFKKDELEHLFTKVYSSKIINTLSGYNCKSLFDLRNIDKVISLEGDMLVKVDRTSMLTSLESRSPFLSTELWNFSNQLPDNYLINRFNKKYILKEAFQDYFPENFLNKSKQGFGVPVGNWLRSTLKNDLIKYSNTDLLKAQNIFNINYIQEIVHNHINFKEDNSFKVWVFYCFQKWYFKIYEA